MCVGEHLPGDVIGDRLQLMEGGIAEDPIRCPDRHAVETVVDHEVGPRQGVRQVVLDVEPRRGDRHVGFVDEGHLHLAVFCQQRETQHPVAAAKVYHLAGTVDRQIVQHEAGAYIQAGAREDVGMVVDEHVGALQRPDGREWTGQGRAIGLRLAVNKARLLPGQRGASRSQVFLEQLEGGAVNVFRLAGGQDAGGRGDYRTQGQQLLLQQRLILGDLDHHQCRG